MDKERAKYYYSNGNPKPAAATRDYDAVLDENEDGRDPREIDPAVLRAFGHSGVLLKAVRQNCLDCQGDNAAEVRRCRQPGCPMWPYRMGTNPFHTVKLSENERARRRALVLGLRKGSGAIRRDATESQDRKPACQNGEPI